MAERLTLPELRILKDRYDDRTRYATMLGSALLDFESAKARFMAAIQKSQEIQRQQGIAILREHGYDPDNRELRIVIYGYTAGARTEDDGKVQELVSGAWVDVEK